MRSHIPDSNYQRGDQATGENASSLQRAEAEDVAPVMRVGAPVVDDVKNLRAQNARQHHEDAQIPSVISIDALLLRIADTDPNPQQNAGCDEHTIGGQIEVANLKKSREHVSLDAPIRS